ncbi:MAG: mucoidy inhibitor MuiA family protein [Phycisphaerales bacterium]|nr:mucoidy inhibitor MuiA family protein [Phycisphaerales bacterium]
MMRCSTLLVAGLAVSSMAAAAWSQPSTELTGRIDEVTVYRGQALVTRLVAIPGQAGLQEVVVTGLPEAIAPASLYADAGSGVRVRSIRYRERPVERDTRDEVMAIDAQIEQVERAQREGEQEARLLGEERAYLAQLEQFGGQTAVTELRSGVLDADTIKSLSQFVFTERERLSGAELAQQERARQLAAQLEQLQRERATVAGATARTVREAVLFVEADPGSKRELRLRYLVNEATWEPSYTIRTDESHTGVVVEYFAAIQQLSGEDWGDVSMTLSTATASLVARAPGLEPLRLALVGERPSRAWSRPNRSVTATPSRNPM